MMVPDWGGYLAHREAFSQVADPRYFPMEWLDQRILSGAAQFIRSDNAGMVFELRQFPGGAIDVHCLIAAGNKDEIINELAPQAEAWGQENGAIAAVVESRPGWAKALKPHGYELSQMTVRKEFHDGH
jgi:hypothetical protein